MAEMTGKTTVTLEELLAQRPLTADPGQADRVAAETEAILAESRADDPPTDMADRQQ